MTLNSDAKFEEEPTWHYKNDMRNLHFDGVLMSKEYKILIKQMQRSYL